MGTRGQPPSGSQSARELGSAHTPGGPGPLVHTLAGFSPPTLLTSSSLDAPAQRRLVGERDGGRLKASRDGVSEVAAPTSQPHEPREMNGTLPGPPAQERPTDTTAPAEAGVYPRPSPPPNRIAFDNLFLRGGGWGILRIRVSTDTATCPSNVSTSGIELHFPVTNHVPSPLE